MWRRAVLLEPLFLDMDSRQVSDCFPERGEGEVDVPLRGDGDRLLVFIFEEEGTDWRLTLSHGGPHRDFR